jgi:hypothetical protein
MGIVAVQQVHTTGSVVTIPFFAEQQPGDRIILCWQEFAFYHDGPNTTQWNVYPAGNGAYNDMQCYVLEREVTNNEPPGGYYSIGTDNYYTDVSVVAILLRGVGPVEALSFNSNSLTAPGFLGDPPSYPVIQFHVWNVYQTPSVASPQLPPGPELLIRARRPEERAEVVVGIIESRQIGDSYTATASPTPGQRAAYSFWVPVIIPTLDPIALSISEDISGLWLYPNIQMTLPPTEALDPETAYTITDELGNALYVAYPREENRSDELVAYTFYTPLARLAEVYPVQPLLVAAPLGQPYSAKQALELILNHWRSKEGYNWLTWEPLPEIYIRGLDGNIAPTLEAVTLIPADNPDERQTAQEWLEEFLGAFEGYFFRDTPNGTLELVAPYWATSSSPAVTLTSNDLLEGGGGRVIPFTEIYNRATVSNKPWTFGDAVEVVTANDTAAGATSITLQQAPSDPLPSGSTVAFQLVDGSYVVVTLTAQCTTTTMQVQAIPAAIPAGTPGRSSVRVPSEVFPPAGLRVRGQSYTNLARSNGHDNDGALPSNVVNLGDVVVPDFYSNVCLPWEINPNTLLEPSSTMYLEITAQAYYVLFYGFTPVFFSANAEIRPLHPTPGSWSTGPLQVPVPADGQRYAVAEIRQFVGLFYGTFSMRLYAEWDGRRLLLSYETRLRSDGFQTAWGAFTLELHGLGLSWREGSQRAVGRFGFAVADLPQVPGLAESQARAVRPAPERSIEVYSLGRDLLERVQRCVEAARAIVVNRYRPQELLELRIVPPYQVRPEHMGRLVELDGLNYELYSWQYGESHSPSGSQSELVVRLRKLPVAEAVMLLWESGEGAVYESGEGIILQEVN